MVREQDQLMSDEDPSFAGAPIKFESYVRGPDDMGIRLFTIEPPGKKILFEVAYRYGEDGNDFHVVISNFGLSDRGWAGSKSSRVQMKFSPEAAESARGRIVEFFSGAEDKPFMPFSVPQARFRGVEFAKSWINEK
jgi:hypothetical protein